MHNICILHLFYFSETEYYIASFWPRCKYTLCMWRGKLSQWRMSDDFFFMFMHAKITTHAKTIENFLDLTFAHIPTHMHPQFSWKNLQTTTDCFLHISFRIRFLEDFICNWLSKVKLGAMWLMCTYFFFFWIFVIQLVTDQCKQILFGFFSPWKGLLHCSWARCCLCC